MRAVASKMKHTHWRNVCLTNLPPINSSTETFMVNSIMTMVTIGFCGSFVRWLHWIFVQERWSCLCYFLSSIISTRLIAASHESVFSLCFKRFLVNGLLQALKTCDVLYSDVDVWKNKVFETDLTYFSPSNSSTWFSNIHTALIVNNLEICYALLKANSSVI